VILPGIRVVMSPNLPLGPQCDHGDRLGGRGLHIERALGLPLTTRLVTMPVVFTGPANSANTGVSCDYSPCALFFYCRCREKRWRGNPLDGVVLGRCLPNTTSDEDRPQA
jgi:hypothetical protein